MTEMVDMERLARVWRKMQDKRDELKHAWEAADKVSPRPGRSKPRSGARACAGDLEERIVELEQQQSLMEQALAVVGDQPNARCLSEAAVDRAVRQLSGG